MDEDKAIKSIVETTKQLMQLIEHTAMPVLRVEIDAIVSGGDSSEREIERILDQLLNYIPLGYGEKEFKRLNAYYAKINPDYSRAYDGFYRELFEE